MTSGGTENSGHNLFQGSNTNLFWIQNNTKKAPTGDGLFDNTASSQSFQQPKSPASKVDKPVKQNSPFNFSGSGAGQSSNSGGNLFPFGVQKQVTNNSNNPFYAQVPEQAVNNTSSPKMPPQSVNSLNQTAQTSLFPQIIPQKNPAKEMDKTQSSLGQDQSTNGAQNKGQKGGNPFLNLGKTQNQPDSNSQSQSQIELASKNSKSGLFAKTEQRLESSHTKQQDLPLQNTIKPQTQHKPAQQINEAQAENKIGTQLLNNQKIQSQVEELKSSVDHTQPKLKQSQPASSLNPITEPSSSLSPKLTDNPGVFKLVEPFDESILHKEQLFSTKPLEYIVLKWQKQVIDNETQFQEAVEQVSEYERHLTQSLIEMEQLETQTEAVNSSYKQTIEQLCSISTGQNVMLDELKTIETELDKMLQLVGSHQIDPYLVEQLRIKEHMQDWDKEWNETEATKEILDDRRQKVFEQALNLESQSQNLSISLCGVERQMKFLQDNHERVAQRCLFRGSVERRDVSGMEETLSNFYASMKCVEAATMDLGFQVKELEERVDLQQRKK